VDSCISEPEKTHRDWAKNNDERPTKSHVKQRPETGINRAVSTSLQYSNIDKAFELLGGLLDDPEFSIDGNSSNTPRVLTWNHSPVENIFLQESHIASGSPFEDVNGNASYGTVLRPMITATCIAEPLSSLQSGVASLITKDMVSIHCEYTNSGGMSVAAQFYLEVRDSAGVTVYLEAFSAPIGSGGTAYVADIWSSEAEGSYQLRTFAVSDVGGSDLLLPVSNQAITIGTS
jgi:hypothetical protein